MQRPQAVKNALLQWSASYTDAVFLDSNNHTDKYGRFDCLLAVGAVSALRFQEERHAFDKLQDYRNRVDDWIFGYLTYDLKNDLEPLHSHNLDKLDFPALYFFQPEKICILKGNVLSQLYLAKAKDQFDADFNALIDQPSTLILPGQNKLQIKQRITKDQYLAGAKAMLAHIQRGNIYEANFCQEFFAEGKINALQTFKQLNEISQAPFAAYFKNSRNFILCTSPERYLHKNGTTVVSQPIKGTARRSADPVKDGEIAKKLEADLKERTENIMITDLVRNDLSRIAQKGSVNVDELCKVYPYRQVHQMITTISAKAASDISPVDILKKTFPMGSMTGAPKIAAMHCIEKLEHSKRGVYSGALGYFMPCGDFDFNVIIRSILYNEEREYISFSVGSAITAKAHPEREYKECLLKAKAMREVLG